MQLSTSQKEALELFFSSRPVKRAYLFGSYARNQADEKSDIDILLELDYKEPIGMKFFSYKDDLEELLKVKVDVLTTDGMSPRVKPYVDREKLLIYERTAA